MQPFEWTEEHEASFDVLKHALTAAPVLSYPDFSKEFFWKQMFHLKVWVQSCHRWAMMEKAMSSHMLLGPYIF